MSEARSVEQVLEALRKNPSYTLPPGADQYAFWRMALCIRNDPEDPPPLDDESVNRIFAAVGHLPIPPDLDSDPIFHQLRKWLMRQYLIWCPYWYREAVKLSSSKLEKNQIRRLNEVRRAADKLNDLLSDSEGLSLGFAPRITPMIEAIDRQLASVTDSKGPDLAYRDSFRKRSAFEWFIGQHLPLVFQHIFCQPAGISRGARPQPDGPYIRFAESALRELQITNRGHFYSRESIARALSDARKERVRRKRRAAR